VKTPSYCAERVDEIFMSMTLAHDAGILAVVVGKPARLTFQNAHGPLI
jgi:hypothetical protein